VTSAILPDAVRRAVEAGLEDLTGRARAIVRWDAVGGGCISPSASIEIDDGEVHFLKWSAGPTGGLFSAEADGLEALAAAAPSPLRVPRVVALGTSWLLLEFIDRGRDGPAWASELGSALALLHQPAAGPCGWRRDNFIGSLPQANAPDGHWGRFYRERRLLPLLGEARGRGHLGGGQARVLDQVVERVPELLGPGHPAGPSLLHGDLWSGNVFPDGEGRPVVVDPAVYRGDPEVDLAMSELFGFPAGFQPAYREVRPVDRDYERFRRDLYQLYYLLVHVALFGAGYEAGCLRAARRVLAAGGGGAAS
jgi:fructosamine-3-kinase